MTQSDLHLPPASARTSEILRALADSIGPDNEITIEEIFTVFGTRGFVLLIMLLALLNIAVVILPGASLLLGAPMVFLAAQMALGYQHPWLPHFISQKKIRRETLLKGFDDAIKLVEALESYIKPRFAAVAGPQMDRINGVVLMILAIMVALPIPFFNIPPSLGIIAIALGTLERDGFCVTIGYFIAVSCGIMFLMLGTIFSFFTSLVAK